MHFVHQAWLRHRMWFWHRISPGVHAGSSMGSVSGIGCGSGTAYDAAVHMFHVWDVVQVPSMARALDMTSRRPHGSSIGHGLGVGCGPGIVFDARVHRAPT